MKKTWLLSLSSITLLSLVFICSSYTQTNRRHKKVVDTTTLPGFTFAKDHKGVNVVNASGLITLTTGLENDYYLLDSVSRNGYLYIETKMGRIVNHSAKRVPLNLSIVIDRSGFMQREKMEFARKAAKDIIDRLTADDYVSVVIYDEIVELLQPSVRVTQKDSIKAKIDKVKSRGSTNLWGVRRKVMSK